MSFLLGIDLTKGFAYRDGTKPRILSVLKASCISEWNFITDRSEKKRQVERGIEGLYLN
jgi:hypothetical protein